MEGKDYTIEVLRAISTRLSSRPSCKGVEYLVFIDPNRTINFLPYQEVYPDIHHKQKANLRNIVYHVLATKFADTVYDGIGVNGLACFKPDSLTPGAYKYMLSFNKKRRKWVKL